MKTTRFLLFVTALSPATFLCSSCAKSESDQPVAPSVKAAAGDVAAAVTAAAAEVKATAADSWEGIKDYTYEKREAFAAALERMAGKLDADMREVAAKVAGRTETDTVKQRKVALKEFNDANIYLKSLLADLRSGTADTWDNAKEKVARGWQSEQAAYAKVKALPAP